MQTTQITCGSLCGDRYGGRGLFSAAFQRFNEEWVNRAHPFITCCAMVPLQRCIAEYACPNPEVFSELVFSGYYDVDYDGEWGISWRGIYLIVSSPYEEDDYGDGLEEPMFKGTIIELDELDDLGALAEKVQNRGDSDNTVGTICVDLIKFVNMSVNQYFAQRP